MTQKDLSPLRRKDIARTTEGYVQSWYAKDADLPKEYWDTKENAGGGWYCYKKLTPYDHGLDLKDLRWPNAELFNAQVEWDERFMK